MDPAYRWNKQKQELELQMFVITERKVSDTTTRETAAATPHSMFTLTKEGNTFFPTVNVLTTGSSTKSVCSVL